MNILFTLLELSPVIMAVITIVVAGFRYQHARTVKERIFVMVAMVASGVLILAQTALFISLFVTHEPRTMLNYALWSIFNNLTMLLILLYILPVRRARDAVTTIE